MVTTTLDEVVRKTLAKSELPLHYYLKYLLMAVDGLKELKYTILPAEDIVEITLDANSEATLPVDFVGEVGLYYLDGDKLIEVPRNYLLSTSAIPVGGFEEGSGESTALEELGLSTFGEISPRENGWRIIQNTGKIRVDNATEFAKLYLKYVTMPKKSSNKTVVHPFVEPAVVAYINWQVAFYASKSDVMIKRAEYFNERRLAKGKLSRVSITDILSSFRLYYNQSIKA